MKKTIQILLVVSVSLPLIVCCENHLTAEEKWQRAKEVLWSGEVAYSLLAVVLTCTSVRYLWPWVSHRIELKNAIKQMEKIKLILKKEEQEGKPKKETEIQEFCETELKILKKKINCLYNKDERKITIWLKSPELRDNPHLENLFNILYITKLDDDLVLGKIESTIIYDNVKMPEGVMSRIMVTF